MAEESIPQFRSPLPNIGVGYSGGGGGGGMPQTTAKMEQLKKYISELGGSIVANRKLNIEKEIADAEMNVALGMVKPPTESMQENRLVMDKYNAVRARNFGIEDANLLLDQADAMVAESMEGFVFGSEDQESPAKKLVDKLEEFNAGVALREDRQEPTLLLNKNYTEQILMARQKVEGALREQVQKESIRQRTIVAKSAIKNKLQELGAAVDPMSLEVEPPSQRDFKRIYKELAPQFPLLGPQVEVLIYEQTISDAIETIKNPAATEEEAIQALTLARALDQPGYARNNMSLAEIVNGRNKISGASGGVQQALTAYKKRVDDKEKDDAEHTARILATLTDDELVKFTRNELASMAIQAKLPPAETRIIFDRFRKKKKTNLEDTNFRNAYNEAKAFKDSEILKGSPDDMATELKIKHSLGEQQEGDIFSIIKARQEQLEEEQETLLEETQRSNYIGLIQHYGKGSAEARIKDLYAEDGITEAQRDAALEGHKALTESLEKIEDEKVRKNFLADISRMDLPIWPNQRAEQEALLQKYTGYKDLQGRLKDRFKELKEYNKFQSEFEKEKKLATDEYLRLLETPEELEKIKNIRNHKNNIFNRFPDLAEKLINAQDELLKPVTEPTKQQKLNNRSAGFAFREYMSPKMAQEIKEKEINKTNFPKLFADGVDPSYAINLTKHKTGLLQADKETKREIAKNMESYLLRESNARVLASADLDEESMKEVFKGNEDILNSIKAKQLLLDKRLKDPKYTRMLFYRTGDNILKFDQTKLTEEDKKANLLDEDLLELQLLKDKKIEENKRKNQKYNFRIFEDSKNLIGMTDKAIEALTGVGTEETGQLIADRDFLEFEQRNYKEEVEYVNMLEQFITNPREFTGMSAEEVQTKFKWKGEEPLTAWGNGRKSTAIQSFRDFIKQRQKVGDEQMESVASVFITNALLEPDFKQDDLYEYLNDLALEVHGMGIGTQAYERLTGDIQKAVATRETDFTKWENATLEMFNNYILIPKADTDTWQFILDTPTASQLLQIRADFRKRFRKELQDLYKKNPDLETIEIQEQAVPILEKFEIELRAKIPDLEKNYLKRLNARTTPGSNINSEDQQMLDFFDIVMGEEEDPDQEKSDNESESN